MGRHQDCLSSLLFLLNQLDKGILHQRIQSAGRLIQNQHLGIMHKSRYDSQLLLHSLGHATYGPGWPQLKALQQLLCPSAVLHVPVTCHKAQKFLTAHFIQEIDFSRYIAKLSGNGIGLLPAVHPENFR